MKEMPKRVFISWSGQESQSVASALRDTIQDLFEGKIQPIVSFYDLSAGSLWQRELEVKLAGSSAGILCITPENVKSDWILYEAGALSKGEFVCPYLIGVEPKE